MGTRSRFAGKVVLVIGGSSGIGLASASAFATEGAQVVLTGRDPTKLEEAMAIVGPNILALRADVTDRDARASVVERIRSDYGHMDVVFACAGTSVRRPVDHMTEQDWDTVMNTNLKGHYFMIQRLLPLMPRGANIVLTASVAVMRPGTGHSVYAASKSALASLTQSLGAELVSRGIRVNAVSPGPIDTPRPAAARISESARRIFRETVAAKNPMRRWGTAEEVAHAVLFLASAEASYITGALLPVDGGAACFS
jgi:NAD(P)-dependent dehydrogenase (short-subunit alcohol dehydrogenase family)